MKCYTKITISNAFRDLIKSQNYEKYVFSIISKSTTIFKGYIFTYNDSQSHGECDFVDNYGRKYDAKLLFDKRQGKLIGENKNDLKDWLQVMLDEKTEYIRSIEERDLSYVEETTLYRIMKERIETLEKSENGIFFIPFPIVEDVRGSIFLQLATDFLQAIYDRLKDNKIIGKRKIYFIYPSMEPHIYVLRNGKRIREYIRCDDLEDFIIFSTTLVKE